MEGNVRVLFEDSIDPSAAWTLIEDGPHTILELDRGPDSRLALSFPSTLLPALRRLLDRTKQPASET